LLYISVSDVVSFNGSSLIRLDLLREPIETDRHFIRFRFKTNNADGILMYSRGTQGDYIALQFNIYNFLFFTRARKSRSSFRFYCDFEPYL